MEGICSLQSLQWKVVVSGQGVFPELKHPYYKKSGEIIPDIPCHQTVKFFPDCLGAPCASWEDLCLKAQGSLCLSTDRVWLDTCPTLTSPYVQPPHHILNLSLMCMSQWGKYWRKCHGQIGHQPLLYGCLSTKMAWSIILISISISVIWAWINLFVILVRHSVRKWLDWGNENNDSNEKVLE